MHTRIAVFAKICLTFYTRPKFQPDFSVTNICIEEISFTSILRMKDFIYPPKVALITPLLPLCIHLYTKHLIQPLQHPLVA